MLTDTFCSGKSYKILNFKNLINQAYKNHLLNLGVFPGTKFTVLRFAPFGETIQIAIGKFSLILRKTELNQLDIEEA